MVERMLARMSLEQKIGQVMLIGLDPAEDGAQSAEMTPQMAGLLAELHAGGLVLFERNVGTPGELARLTTAAQAAVTEGGDPPLIISIDQEGGRVTRLRQARGYTEWPSPMALGATGDPENARLVAEALGRELLAVGINMDLAPVLDVNSNPRNPIIGTRSFGSDPQRVAACGVAFIQGLQDVGVMAVGKHFPGHGDTGIDSHVSLSAVTHDRRRLEAVEFLPFRAAIAAGVAGIMSAHVTFPAVDPTPGLPATLSARVMTVLLRDEMGYGGLLLTDSLEMGALAQSGYSVPAAAVASLAAGADLLCISHGFTVHRQAHAAMMRAIERGEIPMARLDAAVRRILDAKVQYGVLDGSSRVPRAGGLDLAGVGGYEATSLSRRVAEQAITVLRDRDRLLPLADRGHNLPLLVVELVSRGDFASGALRPVVADHLTEVLQAEGLVLPADVDDENIQDVLHQASGKTVILAVADVARHPAQANLLKALVDAHVSLVVITIAAPYDFVAMELAGTCIATYGSNPPVLDALAGVLLGNVEAGGHLPVELA